MAQARRGEDGNLRLLGLFLDFSVESYTALLLRIAYLAYESYQVLPLLCTIKNGAYIDQGN